jgi:hypothetical protein
MSLYRQSGGAGFKALAGVAAAALVIGLVAGFLIGRGTASEPSLAKKLAQLRDRLKPARQGIELTATEYSQAVRGGRVVAPTEYGAAKADVERVRKAVSGARADLRALSAARAAALERSVSALGAAVSRRADPGEVERLSGAADAALTAAVGR